MLKRSRLYAISSGLLGLVLLASLQISAQELPYPTNLFIGTGGAVTGPGNLFPGASRPFGMVRLSPDTSSALVHAFIPYDNGYGTAGYAYFHDYVLGFSHTRLSGTGVREGGFLRVRPENRRVPQAPGLLTLDHALERAEPGYYGVDFAAQGIRAELTATEHCGFHRYSRTVRDGQIFLHIGLGSALAASEHDRDVRYRVRGNRLEASSLQSGDFSERYGGYRLYAYAEFSANPTSVEEGEELRFGFDGGPVEIKVCLSASSAEGARLNYADEIGARGFDEIRRDASRTWNSYLGRGRIQTADEDLKRIYYTALYHSLLMPTGFADADGTYLGFDRERRRATDFTFRTDLSLWDTFRTTHPLFTLIAPEIQCDSVKSLLAMADQTGMLPRWPSGPGEASSMFGSPANFLMTESYLKRTCAFDAQKALRYMIIAARGVPNHPSQRNPECREFGYCPADIVKQAVSKTLEFAWADRATARLARELGQLETAREFEELGRAYALVWDPAARYFAPRNRDGSFAPVIPDRLSYMGDAARAYAEGSANHWRYTAPPQELIRMMGGARAFVREATAFMENRTQNRTDVIPSGGYWHGNEHNLHVPYLFNEAGRPDLTQKWVRWILAHYYANTPDGLAGNDDGGALSSWYVLSAIGLYPQAGTDLYWLGSPNVQAAEWNLGSDARGDGRTLRITAHGQSAGNIYVREVRLNGRRHCGASLRHDQLLNAHLEFFMSATPSRTFDCGR